MEGMNMEQQTNKTRYPELGWRYVGQGTEYQFVDTATDQVIGYKYESKAEMMADIERFYNERFRKMATDDNAAAVFEPLIDQLREAISHRNERIIELQQQVSDMRRIAERNHKANLMPCPNCGYKQAIIRAAESNKGD
jgi:predicted RNA-binding Zn-ribbon protein involved in translation (DUF1610 family)